MQESAGISPAALPMARVWGRVVGCDGATVSVGGLTQLARIGDHLAIEVGGAAPLRAEIIALGADRVQALLMSAGTGLATGQRALLDPIAEPCPDESWLGQVVDAYGRPNGIAPPDQASPGVPLRRRPPRGDRRRGFGPPADTGYAALDTLLPLCRGQRIGVFAGSGVGKSSLITRLNREFTADVVVVGLIGERGREVAEFRRGIEATGALARSVVIAATSDETALAKRRAGLLTLATAEFFRDRGAHVLCLFDSITRYAEAHREIALSAGEAAALRAFPPSTAGELAGLCERAGPGAIDDAGGDITAVFTVLVAGSDMDEPVADMVRGLLDGHVILERRIAERGRMPAIDLPASVSRAAPACWSVEEARLAHRARKLISTYEDGAAMIRAGLYVEGSDPLLDQAVALYPALDGFVGAESPEGGRQASFARLREILGETDGGQAPKRP